MTYALGVTMMPMNDSPSINDDLLASLLLTRFSPEVRAALIELARKEQLGSAVEEAFATAEAFSPPPEGVNDVYAAHKAHVRDAFEKFTGFYEGFGFPGFHRFVRAANNTANIAQDIANCYHLCRRLLEARGDDGAHLITSERVRAYLQEFLSVLSGVQSDHFLNSKRLPGAMKTSIHWFENVWRIVKNCTPESMSSQYREFEHQIRKVQAQREMGENDPEAVAMKGMLADGRYQDLLQIFLETRLPLDGEAPVSHPMPQLPASCAMKPSHPRSISEGFDADAATFGASLCASGGQVFCQPAHGVDTASIATQTFPGLLVSIYPCTPFLLR